MKLLHIVMKPFSMGQTFKRKRASIFCENDLNEISKLQALVLPIGGQQSYGEICLPPEEGVALSMEQARSTIRVSDEEKTVTVDANIRIGELVDFLEDNGYFLPVVPGTPDATVGGCIAADVHGKSSHKYGSFGHHINTIQLYNKVDGLVWVRSGSKVMSKTIGGFGVTGIILRAVLSIEKLPGNAIRVTTHRFDNLLTCVSSMIERTAQHEDLAIWFSVQKKKLYAKLVCGDWCWTKKSLPSKTQFPGIKAIFFKLAGLGFISHLSYSFLARLIYFTPTNSTMSSRIANFPLHYMPGWSRLFGVSFIERQFLVEENQLEEFIPKLIELLRKHKVYSPLCAIKLFNTNGLGQMSFVKRGLSFNILYRSESQDFSNKLSTLLIEFRCREYLAKSRVGHTTFPMGYEASTEWILEAGRSGVESEMIKSTRATFSGSGS